MRAGNAPIGAMSSLPDDLLPTAEDEVAIRQNAGLIAEKILGPIEPEEDSDEEDAAEA